MKRSFLTLLIILTALLSFAEQRDGYSVEIVTVSGHPAYLLTPTSLDLRPSSLDFRPSTFDETPPLNSGGREGSLRYPAVLALHDHGAHFTIGKEKLVRPLWREDKDSLFNARVQAEADKWVHKYYHGMFIADSLAKAGFVVLVTDALYWGERSQGTDNRALKEGQPAFYQKHLAETGEVWFETILREDKEAVSYLCSLPCVDTTRIFSFGFSMGAYRSWQLASADPRIAGCAAANWMTTIRYTGGFITGVSSWSMYRPVPDGAKEADYDYPQIAARISPRPFLLLYGDHDHVIPAKGTQMAIRTISRAYGNSSRKKGNRQFRPTAFPADHEFTSEHYATLLRWLKSY